MLPNWIKAIGNVIAALWILISTIAPTEVKYRISAIIPISTLVDWIFYATIVFAIFVLSYTFYTMVKRNLLKSTPAETRGLSIAYPSREQSIDGFRESLYFFINHWEDYRYSIQRGTLKSPQNGEIKGASYQMKNAVRKMRLMKLRGVDEVLSLVERIANKMSKLGVDVYEQFPDPPLKWSESNTKKISDLISQGNEIYDELKTVIPIVEKALG